MKSKTPCFIVGNGPSRKPIDLSQLPGRVYGCNRLYTDPRCDLVFTTDQEMTKEIANDPNWKGRMIVQPRHGLSEERVAQPDITVYNAERYLPKGNGAPPSGVRALSYAIDYQGYKQVYLLGFDLYSPTKERVKNIYAGTKLYEGDRESVKLVVAEKWKKHLDYYKDKFIRVIDDNCVSYRHWNEITVEEFLSRAAAGSL